MKSSLLLFAMFFAMLFTNVNGQCTFQNPGIKLNSTQTDVGTGGCLINIDLSFDLAHNSGNKWVNIHLWPTALAPAVLPLSGTPNAAALAGTVANIVIDQRSNPLVLSSTYKPDGSIIPQSTGLTLTRIDGPSFDRYIITGITLLAPTGCNISQPFTGYAWSSQASNDNVRHCATDAFSFIANDPKAFGSILCQSPRKYSITITTISPTASGTYTVYRDNGDGILDPLVDVAVATDIAWSATNVVAYQSGATTYAGNNTNPEGNRALFAVVTTAGLSNTIIAQLDNGCGPLPVLLTSFSTARKNNAVSLSWKTATETNINKFEIQKKIGNDFVTVGSVKALNVANGSAYSFIDNNNSTAFTEYRIKTIDNSGDFRYSDIRVVKGLGSTMDFTVFPNPSNGSGKIVISDLPALSNINITDISGRIVKTYNNLNTSSLDIKGLQKGVYFIRLTNSNEVKVVTKKIVIN